MLEVAMARNSDISYALSERMVGVRPSSIMELLKRAGGGDYLNFASGLPDAALFPVQPLAEIAQEIFRDDGAGALQYGPAEGYGPLREWVAERLGHRGMAATPETVLITSGSEQALDLCARAFLDPGDTVCVESPTYAAALQTFDSLGARYAVVGQDESGMDVEAAARVLSQGCKLTYALPNFQNPSGRTMSLERRSKLAEAVRDSGAVLIEDDAYFDLRFEGDDLPALTSLAPVRSLYLGTFSKIISPGLRVGFVHGPAQIIEKLVRLKQISDLHTGSLSQRLVYHYATTGDLGDHVDQLRAAYRSKRDAMLAALHETMPPGVSWTSPTGGMFLWLTVPEGIDSTELLQRAMERKILFVPGSGFSPDGGGQNAIRLNFASPPFVKIAEGIREIARLIST